MSAKLVCVAVLCGVCPLGCASGQELTVRLGAFQALASEMKRPSSERLIELTVEQNRQWKKLEGPMRELWRLSDRMLRMNESIQSDELPAAFDLLERDWKAVLAEFERLYQSLSIEDRAILAKLVACRLPSDTKHWRDVCKDFAISLDDRMIARLRKLESEFDTDVDRIVISSVEDVLAALPKHVRTEVELRGGFLHLKKPRPKMTIEQFHKLNNLSPPPNEMVCKLLTNTTSSCDEITVPLKLDPRQLEAWRTIHRLNADAIRPMGERLHKQWTRAWQPQDKSALAEIDAARQLLTNDEMQLEMDLELLIVDSLNRWQIDRLRGYYLMNFSGDMIGSIAQTLVSQNRDLDVAGDYDGPIATKEICDRTVGSKYCRSH